MEICGSDINMLFYCIQQKKDIDNEKNKNIHYWHGLGKFGMHRHFVMYFSVTALEVKAESVISSIRNKIPHTADT